MATYTYKRWFPPCVVIDGTAIAPAFVLAASNHHWQDEKRQEQAELRAWEGEGGSPAARSVAVQGFLFAAPGQDNGRPD
jgi:hypothetical protein